MASKSRLGKGLGALFPALPGENAPQKSQRNAASVDDNSNSDQIVSRETSKSASAQQKTNQTPELPDRVDVPRETIDKADNSQGSESVPDKQVEAATKISATHGKASSSRPRRASMPMLNDIVQHPSDVFFGEMNAVVSNTDSMTVNSSDTGNTQDSHVSRETNPETDDLKPVYGGYLAEIDIDAIGPNAHQPRTIFDEDELNELAASIKEVGILQPIVVRKRPLSQIQALKIQHAADSMGAASRKTESQDVSRETQSEQSSSDVSHETHHVIGDTNSEYELIMGERRWRAARLAGLKAIPAIVKTTADDDMLRDALLENLHRVALNPLEEAAAYQQMIDEFGLTQAELSKSVSKSRPQIANMLRLLNLPPSVQKKVAAGVLSAGHARALLALSDEQVMDDLAKRIIAEGLSVRSTEEIVALKIAQGEQPKKVRANKNNPWSNSPIQRNLENHFDTKVSIKGSQQHGRIEIVFSSPEDMDRILSMLIPDSQKPNTDSWV
ncbi:ParB/RepB/Spo0J family partition protein [Bifidobacterium jacchi]|uniref:ParB/RepB/Spo0J family partition protein n=1 Tax=Bifidobacterium jacchi TaxID=2490545 RepID=A0A5N5RMN3_9BIFI|nr:ParB/RepB/Spo0J family partition protein [Bifidobacterium jacchi]KAB5608564.1 ParB/RepB/Spo0J family partition protein [Bifidobacterium jacchi]